MRATSFFMATTLASLRLVKINIEIVMGLFNR